MYFAECMYHLMSHSPLTILNEGNLKQRNAIEMNKFNGYRNMYIYIYIHISIKRSYIDHISHSYLFKGMIKKRPPANAFLIS